MHPNEANVAWLLERPDFYKIFASFVIFFGTDQQVLCSRGYKEMFFDLSA